MSEAERAVAVQDLTRRFGDFVAVDHVTFDVRRGEVFGFLGPNGAGKTTTIRIMAGLLLPTSGQGTVAGFDITREAESIKKRIGYMSQLFSLYGDLTVDENIRFFSGLYGVPRERRRERRDWVLQMARLTEEQNRLTGDLSLGYKQRLALGCAILHEPPILFLDEPTSGVDPISRRAFWDLIYKLAADGTTVFVTTHYMEEAEYCNRLALMNRGRLIALDSPGKLRAGLRVPLLQVRTPAAARAVEALEKTPAVVDVGMFGRMVHATVVDRSTGIGAIRATLESQGIPFDAVDEIPPSLEDVFVSLVHAEGGAVDG